MPLSPGNKLRYTTPMSASLPVFVDQAAALPALAEQLLRAPTLYIDLESNGLHAYTAGLCTLQILDPARGDEVIVVDPFRLPDEALAPLRPVLGPQGPLKILHDLSFDSRILAQHGLELGHVFDTALASRFLGVAATGLASLAEARLGLKLSKKLQHHDWGRRPLDEEALAYLAADVRVLPPLAEQIMREVAEKGIQPELDEEILYRLSTAKADANVPDPRPPYVRIKDGEKLPPAALAILREVAEVREQSAKRMNVPPFKVLDNAVLIALATAPPTSAADLSGIRGLQHPRAQALHGPLLEAVARGKAAGDIPASERKEHFTATARLPREVATANRAREQRLTVWRKAEAARRKVDEQAILPGHVLRRLTDGSVTDLAALEATPGVGAFRATRDGAAILAALAGPPKPAAP